MERSVSYRPSCDARTRGRPLLATGAGMSAARSEPSTSSSSAPRTAAGDESARSTPKRRSPAAPAPPSSPSRLPKGSLAVGSSGAGSWPARIVFASLLSTSISSSSSFAPSNMFRGSRLRSGFFCWRRRMPRRRGIGFCAAGSAGLAAGLSAFASRMRLAFCGALRSSSEIGDGGVVALRPRPSALLMTGDARRSGRAARPLGWTRGGARGAARGASATTEGDAGRL